jgi:hypothetical protein
MGRRFYGIRLHVVISVGASTPIRFERTNWRLRHLQIPTTPATAPLDAACNTVAVTKTELSHEDYAQFTLSVHFPMRHPAFERLWSGRKARSPAG